MSTTTLRLGLTKPDVNDGYDISAMVDSNADRLDVTIGFLAATSGTRPSSPYNGQSIRETDTGKYYVSNGGAPASASWTQLHAAGADFTSSNGNMAVTGSAAFVTAGTTAAGTFSNSADGTSALGTVVVNPFSVNKRAVDIRLAGDSVSRLRAEFNGNNGMWTFGDGTNADVNLYRGAANILVTDDALHVGGSLGLLGGTGAAIGLANATTAPTGTPSGGGILYAASGAPYWRDSAGTSTPLLAGVYNDASPTGALSETVPRWMVTANGVEPTGTTTGTVEVLCGIWLAAGTKVTNISFLKGGTAAGTPTHWFFEILSNESSPVVRGHTSDQTTTALPASTLLTKALVTPYTATYTGVYYIALYLAATTVGTWNGVAAAVHTDVVGTTTPRIGGRTAAGTLTPGTDGSTARTFSGNAFQPVYGFVS